MINMSVAVHAIPKCNLISLSVDEILLPCLKQFMNRCMPLATSSRLCSRDLFLLSSIY